MSTDERAIRQFLTTWFEATANDDLDTLLSLTTEDIVFLTPFKPPMDRAEFAREVRVNAGKLRIDAEGAFDEVTVSGDMGYGRGKLTVTITPKSGGISTKLSGYTLSVFRKQADGRWLLSRDANLLQPVE